VSTVPPAPWELSCVSLNLEDEQVRAIALADAKRPRVQAVLQWIPTYDRAPRPVAGSSPCLVYDVRGPEALAKMVYGMSMMWAIGARRIDGAVNPLDMRRACDAFACAWSRPPETQRSKFEPKIPRAGLELAEWLATDALATDAHRFTP